METDWSKVLEVFDSGIVGVFLAMFLLQILTQLSTKVIDVVENWNRGEVADPAPKTPAVSVKD
ncbi:MAG: hypothetical protein OEL55_07570 [Desulfobulbaceae bacterium]|nr:hypothetical protein [Desulfobulbaceae bacterium]